MRVFGLSLLLALSSLAAADRLIDIPTARKLPFGEFRLEYASELSSGRTQLGFLDLGVGTSFEASIRSERIDRGGTVGTFDLTYNYISPIPDLSPGLAFGIQDVANTTQDGRRAFGCVTFREPYETINGEVSGDLTIGFYIKHGAIFYLGAAIPFSKEVFVIAEDDGFRIVSGIDIRPLPNLNLKFLVRGSDTLADLAWTARF